MNTSVMPGRDVELLQKQLAPQAAVSFSILFPRVKTIKRTAVRRDETVMTKRVFEAAEKGLQRDDVVKVCKVGLMLVLDSFLFSGVCVLMTV